MAILYENTFNWAEYTDVAWMNGSFQTPLLGFTPPTGVTRAFVNSISLFIYKDTDGNYDGTFSCKVLLEDGNWSDNVTIDQVWDTASGEFNKVFTFYFPPNTFVQITNGQIIIATSWTDTAPPSYYLIKNSTGIYISIDGEWVLPLDKPVNPIPSDASTGISDNIAEISWEDGANPATSYDIYFGTDSSGLTQLASQQQVNSWKSPFVKLYVSDTYTITGYSGRRPPLVGDILTDANNSFDIYGVEQVSWINTRRLYVLHAFRTGAGGMVVGNEITNNIAPDANDPQAVSVTFDNTTAAGDVEEAYYPYGTSIQWRIDARDD